MDLKNLAELEEEAVDVFVVDYSIEVNQLTCLCGFEKYVRTQSCPPLIFNEHLCSLQLVDKAYRRKINPASLKAEWVEAYDHRTSGAPSCVL